jgi:hypothetical protein
VVAGTDTSSTRAPAGGEGLGRGRDLAGDVVVDALGRELGDEPDAQPGHPLVERRRDRRAARSIDVESIGSWPAMTSSSTAASATLVANGPIWSRLLAKAMRP